jgi:hypothetical protein
MLCLRKPRALPALVLAVAALLLTQAGTAIATSLTRIVYVRGPGAESCPDQMSLRLAVIARLGYDPFSSTAPQTVLAEIARNGDTLRARVDLSNQEGASQGVRELTSPFDQCFDLVRAMALSISIAIDPVAALARRDTEESASNLPASRDSEATSRESKRLPAAELPTPRLVPRRARELRYFTGAGLYFTVHAAPAVGEGAELSWGGRYRAYSLAFEGRVDALNKKRLNSGAEIGAHFLVASLVPCIHEGPLAFCGFGTVGMMRASSSYIAHPSSAADTYSALGLRLGFEWPLAGPLSLRVHADLGAPWPRQSIKIGDNDVWPDPGIDLFLLIGSGLVVHY